jgi:hypothetical protein
MFFLLFSLKEVRSLRSNHGAGLICIKLGERDNAARVNRFQGVIR